MRLFPGEHLEVFEELSNEKGRVRCPFCGRTGAEFDFYNEELNCACCADDEEKGEA